MNDFVAKPVPKTVRIETCLLPPPRLKPAAQLADDAPPALRPNNPGPAFESPTVRKAYDNLVEEIGEAATLEIVTVFVRDTATRLRQLTEFDVIEDRVNVERQAHSLKSAAGIFGLDHLAGLAGALEQRAGELTPDSYGTLVARIGVAFGEAQDCLADLVPPL